MSIVTSTVSEDGRKVDAILLRLPVDKKGLPVGEISSYFPTKEEVKIRAMILKHMVFGTTTMYTPRTEFNDLSVITRDQYDQMSFNTYQSNNGEAWDGDQLSSWRSRAIRPVVRNKCISIAAHATARLIFPKVFAYNRDSEEEQEAAKVMEDLMEWSADESNYSHVSLMRTITALSSPASIGYTEYGEVYRTVKVGKEDDEESPDYGKWIEKKVLDKAFPCFQDIVVPVDQLYIENFYEPDIQKQAWLIWRRVYSYSLAETKYVDNDNFKYVRPGVQTVYDDANRNFYNVYDPNMRSEDVEEIIYWNRILDLKIILVNGVMMTEADNPNPRADKLYPFDKFGYEPINNRCFYYKSLAFKLQHDADIVNTLYQMVVDGTYLSIFKPMVNVGGEIIASDVIVPGSVTTLSSPDADLRAINVGSDLRSGLETLQVVEQSINESSQEPLQQGQQAASGTTAYEISRLENNANTVLGLFLQMIAKHVKDFGKLRLGDIIQYMTLGEVMAIEGIGSEVTPETADQSMLIYKTFLIGSTPGKNTNRKIIFDGKMKDQYSDEDHLDSSYEILQQEKDQGDDVAIYQVNPALFRELSFKVSISPDILNPRSEDLIKAMDLETYDRLVQNPSANQDEALKLLLSTNSKTKRQPDKYIIQQPPPQVDMTGQGMQGQQAGSPQGASMPSAGNSPLASVMGNNSLSTGQPSQTLH